MTLPVGLHISFSYYWVYWSLLAIYKSSTRFRGTTINAQTFAQQREKQKTEKQQTVTVLIYYILYDSVYMYMYMYTWGDMI